MSAFTIAKLAQAGGVGVETVRYYQRRGLMKEPGRPWGSGLSGGVRRYDDDDVRRLRFIKAAQTAGFTLEEIGELLALDATDDRPRAWELARARVEILDHKIAELQRARAALSRLACQIAPKGDPCFAPNNDPLRCRNAMFQRFRRVDRDWGAGEAATQGGRSPTGVAASPAVNPIPCRPRGQLRFLKRQESLPVSMISQ